MRRKSYISLIVIIFILANIVISATAAPAQEAKKEDKTVTETEKETEKKDVDEGEEETSEETELCKHAGSALLMDMNSGKILFEKNAGKKVFPASTTKIMTAILVLENAEDLSAVVTAQKDAIEPITREHSNMGILIGEELTVEQLLYGMLVYSANDAANVLGIHIAGGIDEFASMMNQKATELGCQNTHFTNPHGFHDDNHYTTAYDLALISQYAMKNEKFREIVATDTYQMDATNKYDETRYLTSTNHLISTKRQYDYYYKKATGIKTGYTGEAGSCLVASAKDGDTEFISVVMNCKNEAGVEGAYSFTESKELLEYAFENYKLIPLAKTDDIVSSSSVYEAKNGMRVTLVPDKELSAMLPVDIDVETEIKKTITYKTSKKPIAPIKKGDILGVVKYEYQGEVLGEVNLLANNTVEKDHILAGIHLVLKIITNPVLIIIFLILVFIIVRLRIDSNRRRRKRRQMMNYANSNVTEKRTEHFTRRRQ